MSRSLIAAALLVLGSGCARNRPDEGEREMVYRAETTLTMRVVKVSSARLAIAQGSTFTWTLESDFSRGTVLVQ